MISLFGWVVLAILATYLALFVWGNAMASRAIGRSVWLFGKAKGSDRVAALGFRSSFVVAGFGSMLWLAVPALHKADPLWTEGAFPGLGIIGICVAAVGAMVAVLAQKSMGTSWRVGVPEVDTGALVQAGLFRISRNPTFLGQAMLLAGVALAIPALPTAAAVVIFLTSASLQIRSEEAALARTLGQPYLAYCKDVPRWIGLKMEFPETRLAMGLVLVCVVAFDQITKLMALVWLTQGDVYPVSPSFNLALGFNEGASFGMLSGVMSGRPWAMVALTGGLTLIIGIMALRANNRWERLGLALVVGGSLGNIIDRGRQGMVTDFLDVYWRTWHWPTFNMADVAISLGAVALILAMLRKAPEQENANA
ncbi:signal peptidase II [Pseudorhodobacter wandonensis]|uniref:signal peptidase II n=1 Tax=Pseudorhodobacter wandonensis TaxID=1120568 RepID=UPI000AC86684|nr:signal peptidase II [Pseudorhodobacter wandonensis]